MNPAAPFINWLCHIKLAPGLAWTTVFGKKSALLALLQNPQVITSDPVYVDFVKATQSEEVYDAKNVNFSIQSIKDLFMAQDNLTISIPDLTKKTVWLLGICGFLRPDDLRYTDVL